MLRGERTAVPLTTAAARVAPPRADAASGARLPSPSRGGAGVGGDDVPDMTVFEALRTLRRTIAEERGVPPYVVFSDASLRDMARLRPMTTDAFRRIKGVGDWKLDAFGERFVAAVRQACLASSSAQRE